MKYEMVLMITPSLAEGQAKKSVASVGSDVASLKGRVEKEDFWGKKRLAYEIKRMQEAYYAVLNFVLEPEQVKKLLSKVKSNPEVIRFLLLQD